MTGKERRNRIKELRAELKELTATPRSDWHAGFEALLRIETYEYGNRVQIKTEEVLGEEAPRADYIILTESEDIEFEKDIFKVFRRHNIIEYKNPHDSLNERVIRKVVGYANYYVGVAEHEGDVPSDQVTISIFRAVKNRRLFKSMIEQGSLAEGRVRGIYNVVGITDIPFQIVITSELEGEEYAAYRALMEHAAEEDVERVIDNGSNKKDYAVKEHYRVLVGLIALKNQDIISEARRDFFMRDFLMEAFKKEFDAEVDARVDARVDAEVNARVDAEVNARVDAEVDARVDAEVGARVQEKLQAAKVSDIKNIMDSLNMTVEKAMEALKIPQGQWSLYAGLVENKK